VLTGAYALQGLRELISQSLGDWGALTVQHRLDGDKGALPGHPQFRLDDCVLGES
jgi:hypothetical protein